MRNLKDETAMVIIDRLKDFISLELATELRLAFAIRPSIIICCTVDSIIKNYHSSEENEKTVSDLLEKLLQIHFSPKTINP